ncbi:MAG: rod shape-determining protein RodA [Bacteroidetes bacterium]|nr:rod shape-determining protein RodA [Bacteroidota bacterium]
MESILKRLRYADFLLLLTLVALLVYGLAMVYSATFPSTNSSAVTFSPFVQKQILFVVLGLVFMVLTAIVDYRVLRAFAYVLYGLSLLLLAVVLVAGHGNAEYGSQRWIDLRLFPLQPSELAKPALVLALARYYADHQPDVRSFRHFAISILFAIPPTALVYIQPDLGTSVSFLFIWFFMALAAGVRGLYLGLTIVLGSASLPVIWSMLQGYMRDRITIFLHPESDPWGQGYNIIQAQISIGSGGMFGRGFLAGTQSQGHFLRIQHSDFIFSVLSEEMGFVGAVLLFALFTLLLMRILRAAHLSRDHFGRLVAAGIAVTLIFTVTVNIGANVRLMPVTGIPLTFISYGGSSMITNLACMGIIQSILMRRKRFLRP